MIYGIRIPKMIIDDKYHKEVHNTLVVESHKEPFFRSNHFLIRLEEFHSINMKALINTSAVKFI